MKNIFIIILFSLLFSCKNKDSGDFKVLNIDTNEQIVRHKLSAFFEVEKKIKLNTKNRNLIASIDKILVHKNFIFILNRFSSPGVYIFDTKGEFIKKITVPFDETQNIYDFLIDSQKIEMLVAGKVLFFDVNTFEYINSKRIDYPSTRFYKTDEYYYLVNGKGQDLLMIADMNFNKQIQYLKEHPSHGVYPYNSFININKDLFFFKNYSNALYQIKGSNLKIGYKIIFNGVELDEAELGDIKNFKTEKSNPFFYKEVIKEFFFSTNKHFYFSFIKKSKEYVAIVNKSTRKVMNFDVSNVENDITNEKYFPFIVGKDDEFLISVKNLESSFYKNEDFELFFLKPTLQ
ncbi:6-bladed beta-propeller [Polaribacter litorisediminis]|uniref:6-bladed beta-propeller n=1 Tax=Polaribacter litorisediminis TaxID=1908341 RepID=UPI001CBC4F1F|nr:6-bladed beta-propeller [Polaribacter litorisediminis]UAM98032.1 6-bladed beta-propeller [Polaribacter litorisediminis]